MAKRWECVDCGELKRVLGQQRCDTCYEKWYRHTKAVRVRKQSTAAPKGKKWCPRCQQYQLISKFGRNGDHLAAYCKFCYNHYLLDTRLIKEYGITAEEYFKILEHQKGGCAICGRPPRKKRLSVDHDHKTGKVRGLLCVNCNSLLGRVRDDPDLLSTAVDYLYSSPAEEIGLDKTPDKEPVNGNSTTP